MSCLYFQYCWKSLVFATSPENPDRICQPGSTCARFGRCLCVTSFILSCVSAFYFISLILGFGVTWIVFHNSYNMTTGYKCNRYGGTSGCIACYWGKGDNLENAGFYFFCFMYGIGYELILTVAGLISVWLFNRCKEMMTEVIDAVTPNRLTTNIPIVDDSVGLETVKTDANVELED